MGRPAALAAAKGVQATPAAIDRLALEFGEEDARWAVTQWALRERGRAKFERAGEMLFDRDGLEMASHEAVARAAHLVGEPGEPVGDLTAGIGADLIALAGRGPAIGFEIDPERAELALHNLAVHGLTGEVKAEDCLAAEWRFEAAFADPARRAGGRRTLDPGQFSPRLDALVDRMAGLREGLVKLSPMLDDGFLESLGPDRTFVSHAGECKEALVAAGRERRRRGVWALHVESGAWLEGGGTPPESVEVPGEWVSEADPAGIRAHALGRLGLLGLGDSNGYLTGPGPLEGPWARGQFLVRWAGPWRVGPVKAALRGLGGRVTAVKSRGLDIDVRRVARDVAAEGGQELVLLLYPFGRAARAVLAVRQ